MAAFATLAFSGAGHTAELPLGLGGSIDWTSDYIVRGISQSDNLPALQADLHLHPAARWMIGAWASTAHLLPDTHSTEMNFYLDTRWPLNPDFSVGVTAVHYEYAHDPRPVSYRYDELSLSADWEDAWFFDARWSPNHVTLSIPGYVFRHQQTLTLEASYHRPLFRTLDVHAGAGYFAPLQQHAGRYAYGSAGISHRVGPLRVDLTYIWIQDKAFADDAAPLGPAGGPWVAMIIWDF